MGRQWFKGKKTRHAKSTNKASSSSTINSSTLIATTNEHPSEPTVNEHINEYTHEINDTFPHLSLDQQGDMAQLQETVASSTQYSSFKESTNQDVVSRSAKAPADPTTSTGTDLSKYKGFSSSITHIFQSPSTSRRVDCCAISCCGILQSDYNRYVLMNKRPPTFIHRLLQHILVPVSFFLIAGYCSIVIPDRTANQIVCTALVTLCIGWILSGCIRSTFKRAKVRRELLRKVVQRERGILPQESEDSEDDTWVLPQSTFEVMCVHRTCGGYKADFNLDGEEKNEEEEADRDLCSCLSKLFSKVFCLKLFGCSWQICGTCAIAQEGRQLDYMVPVQKRRMDYVTFQFYMDYVNELRQLREDGDMRIASHFKALSLLSRMLMTTLGVTIITMFLFSVCISPRKFQLGNYLVFVATFLQAFLILYFVHWAWNRLDISIDAVIKYFACGFILSTSTAIVFELIESLSLQLVMLLLMGVVGVELDNDDGYQASNYFSSFRPYTTFLEHSPLTMYQQIEAETYKAAFQRQHPFLTIIYLFLNAYFVAAFVEELSKYFGYKMVEHPDFLTNEELEESTKYSYIEPVEEDRNAHDGEDSDEESFDGGACGPACGPISALGACGPMAAAECGPMVVDLHATKNGQKNSSRFLDAEGGDKDKLLGNDVIIDTNGGLVDAAEKDNGTANVKTPVIPVLLPASERSSNSVGAGITVAMVSVALGFACCENLIYIFFYNGSSLGMEIGVLISRSFFPVHPLCAAIQSIGVCKQVLEKDRNMKLGQIVFPALLLHGSYDFSIMLLNFLATLNTDENGHAPVWYGLIALILSISFVLGGWIYYVTASKAQIGRLDQIETSRNFFGVGTTSVI